MTVVALIEIRAEDASQVIDRIEGEKYVKALYELVGRFNIGIIAEVENDKVLFEVVIEKIRTIPGVKETKTHLIQDGMVL